MGNVVPLVRRSKVIESLYEHMVSQIQDDGKYFKLTHSLEPATDIYMLHFQGLPMFSIATMTSDVLDGLVESLDPDFDVIMPGSLETYHQDVTIDDSDEIYLNSCPSAIFATLLYRTHGPLYVQAIDYIAGLFIDLEGPISFFRSDPVTPASAMAIILYENTYIEIATTVRLMSVFADLVRPQCPSLKEYDRFHPGLIERLSDYSVRSIQTEYIQHIPVFKELISSLGSSSSIRVFFDEGGSGGGPLSDMRMSLVDADNPDVIILSQMLSDVVVTHDRFIVKERDPSFMANFLSLLIRHILISSNSLFAIPWQSFPFAVTPENCIAFELLFVDKKLTMIELIPL